jgi:hypothetical protein
MRIRQKINNKLRAMCVSEGEQIEDDVRLAFYCILGRYNFEGLNTIGEINRAVFITTFKPRMYLYDEKIAWIWMF